MSSERTALYELITEDTELNELGISADSVFNANDVDTVERRPFVVIRWRETTPVFGSTGRRTVSIWAHDAPSDYTTIDAILKRVKTLLMGATHLTGTDGSRITMFDYLGDSEDFNDDGYGTITRNSTWQALPHW